MSNCVTLVLCRVASGSPFRTASSMMMCSHSALAPLSLLLYSQVCGRCRSRSAGILGSRSAGVAVYGV